MSGFAAILMHHRDDGAARQDAAILNALHRRGPHWRQSFSLDPVLLCQTGDQRVQDDLARGHGARSAIRCIGDIRIDDRTAFLHRLATAGRVLDPQLHDTTIIAHAYDVWQDRLLDHLIGDFSFAIWDDARQQLFAARDQVGVTQLFVAECAHGHVLTNTLDAALHLHGIDRGLDEAALLDCAVFGYFIDATMTPYRGIRRVAPGHAVMIRDGKVQDRPYWRLTPPPARLKERDPRALAEGFRSVFDEAVADRLRGIDAAGIQLSGGMDSTSIAATIATLTAHNDPAFTLRAFTIHNEHLFDDQEFILARLVADHLKIAIDGLGQETREQPAAPDPAAFPSEPGPPDAPGWHDINKRTDAFAPLLFMGFGGDPLLARPDPSLRNVARYVRRGDWMQGGRDARSLLGRFARAALGRGSARLPDLAWLHPDLRARAATRMVEHVKLSERSIAGMAAAPLWRAIFQRSDPGYHGLPLKSVFPFFDLRLIAFMQQVPVGVLDGNKTLLRTAMQDRLPLPILQRPKTTLPPDIHRRWLTVDGIPPWQRDVLSGATIRNWVDPAWLATTESDSVAQLATALAPLNASINLAYWLSAKGA